MSKYKNIIPDNLRSDSFKFYNASIDIETDSDAPGNEYQPKWMFFVPEGYHYGATNFNPPPFCRNQIEQITYNRPL